MNSDLKLFLTISLIVILSFGLPISAQVYFSVTKPMNIANNYCKSIDYNGAGICFNNENHNYYCYKIEGKPPIRNNKSICFYLKDVKEVLENG